MSCAFAVAGVLQTSLERIQGQTHMEAAEPIRFWMLAALLHGVLVIVPGVVCPVIHLFTPKPAATGVEAQPAGG